MNILIVDDEPAVRQSIQRALILEEYSVRMASDGLEALTAISSEQPDVVILDVLMPGIDGLEVARRLRRAGNDVPILMLTAREAIDDRVAGLDAGADDYLVKPFALAELLARVRALHRRNVSSDDQVLRFADLTLDPNTLEVHRGTRPLELTRTEYLLLELFLRHPRQVLTRSVIFEQVWGYDFGYDSNSLEVYIGYLRRKLEELDEPRLIHTKRGFGYVLREHA
ncbi:MAG TPA: response regulator transcription factor [Chloroflexota bacterium]